MYIINYCNSIIHRGYLVSDSVLSFIFQSSRLIVHFSNMRLSECHQMYNLMPSNVQFNHRDLKINDNMLSQI